MARVQRREPPPPGDVALEQTIAFAEALLKGEKNRPENLKNVRETKVRKAV